MRPALLSLSFALLLACQSKAPPEQRAAEAASAVSAKPQAKTFGEAITATQRQELRQVLSAPESYAGKTVLVEGHVRKACSRRGCWMEIADGSDPQAPGCRVTFKDYGFFVPTDSAGSTALVQGTVEVASVPARHVGHLEDEGASFSSKQPDGTAREVRLIASGVELRRM
ncbi:MAG TPA: DUF4920 domain-containing protein [Polyangiaceae bacterium]|jgi:hypothetical protein|nr:DUF4920 domain-containing protein [Polyangiaceae bacterium]